MAFYGILSTKLVVTYSGVSDDDGNEPPRGTSLQIPRKPPAQLYVFTSGVDEKPNVPEWMRLFTKE